MKLILTTRPADIPTLPNTTFKQKNAFNVSFEKANDTSVTATRTYEAAVKLSSSAAGGAPLTTFFEYSDREKKLLVSSRDLCDAVGPLPGFLIEYIAEQRLIAAETEADEKAKREQERVDKELEKLKASRPVIGNLTFKNPHPIASALNGPVIIPDIFLVTLAHKIRLPLHCWTDNNLRNAVGNPHTIPKEWIRAEQTSALQTPEKVQVVDVTKLTKIMGAEEVGVTLTPGSWRQASQNLLEAFRKLCPASDPNNPTASHATEYATSCPLLRKPPGF